MVSDMFEHECMDEWVKSLKHYICNGQWPSPYLRLGDKADLHAFLRLWYIIFFLHKYINCIHKHMVSGRKTLTEKLTEQQWMNEIKS